jgi:2-C-methyl-D-erythritol 4-phosphate cytidylyltransferase
LPPVGPVVLVTRPADREFVEELVSDLPDPRPSVVAGGASRQESELRGLRALAPRIRAGQVDTVLIHDGARPLVSAELATRVIDTAQRYGGAVPGVDRTDLAVPGSDGTIVAAAPDGLVAVQTPQGFAAAPLLAAYERADRDGWQGTDTASCVQHYTELPVYRVAGDPANLKITYPHDLLVAEAVLRGR